jgi:hypothetical protein
MREGAHDGLISHGICAGCLEGEEKRHATKENDTDKPDSHGEYAWRRGDA